MASTPPASAISLCGTAILACPTMGGDACHDAPSIVFNNMVAFISIADFRSPIAHCLNESLGGPQSAIRQSTILQSVRRYLVFSNIVAFIFIFCAASPGAMPLRWLRTDVASGTIALVPRPSPWPPNWQEARPRAFQTYPAILQLSLNPSILGHGLLASALRRLLPPAV